MRYAAALLVVVVLALGGFWASSRDSGAKKPRGYYWSLTLHPTLKRNSR
jgi:hypothetical protein